MRHQWVLSLLVRVNLGVMERKWYPPPDLQNWSLNIRFSLISYTEDPFLGDPLQLVYSKPCWQGRQSAWIRRQLCIQINKKIFPWIIFFDLKHLMIYFFIFKSNSVFFMCLPFIGHPLSKITFQDVNEMQFV